MRALAMSSLVFVVAFGCSSSNPSSGFGTGDDSDSGSYGDDGGIFNGDASFTNGDGGNTTGQNCSDAAKLVYVLSSENDLYSFSPPDKVFKKIGALGCNTTMTPNSMAVDRDANAYVNYVESDQITGKDTNGAIFKVNTSNAACTKTNIGLINKWYRIGMGFSTDSAMGTAETLYVAATGGGTTTNSPGLGKIDFSTNQLVTLGSFTGSLAGKDAELTGTGDARLFGFFTTMPVQVAELNKASGAVTSAKPLNGVEVPAFWAFSFWGGDFYLYTAPDATTNPTRTSNVTHYNPSTNAVDTSYMTNVGFHIVGAGVSTCAPITPPK